MGLRLLVVNQYYRPDYASSGQLLSDLCEGLVDRGFEVSAVTGAPSYSADSPPAPATEVLDGVAVRRISLGGRRGRSSLLTRGFSYSRFMYGAWRATRETGSTPPDAILTLSNPPSVGLIGARVARRLNVPYLYVLYDIFPDVASFSARPRLPWPAVPLWNRMNRTIFGAATRIAVPGEYMKRRLVEAKGVAAEKIEVIPNWARPELLDQTVEPADLRAQGINGDRLVVLYAGNHGVMHPLSPLLDAAERLESCNVSFLFVGDGARKARLMEEARARNLNNVLFLPYQPESEFTRILARADLAVVTMEPGMQSVAVPSRVYTFLSAGKPIIGLMPQQSDIGELIRRSNCGWVCEKPEEIETAVRGLLDSPSTLQSASAAAVSAYKSSFRKDLIIERYAELLKSMVNRNRFIGE